MNTLISRDIFRLCFGRSEIAMCKQLGVAVSDNKYYPMIHMHQLSAGYYPSSFAVTESVYSVYNTCGGKQYNIVSVYAAARPHRCTKQLISGDDRLSTPFSIFLISYILYVYILLYYTLRVRV